MVVWMAVSVLEWALILKGELQDMISREVEGGSARLSSVVSVTFGFSFVLCG